MNIKNRPEINGSCVLVTGGAGFIGSHLVDSLLDNGAKEVVIIDSMFNGREANLAEAISKGAILYKDDAEIVSSLDYIFSRHAIDIVINAATKALNYSFVNPFNAFNTNTTVILNLMEFQRKKAFKTLCHLSTSEVYGSAIYEPMDEKHPLLPTTTYAAGKAAADIALESYVRMFGLDAFIVRPFNNYGPRQNYKGYLAAVIPATAWKILNGQPPEIHGTGLQSRDFIYVFDTVDAILKLLPIMNTGESVNISSDGQIAISEVIEKISKELGYTGVILQKESRKSDVECHIASNRKLRSLIDYSVTDFHAGLAQTLAWYQMEFNATKNLLPI